jgi:hypothetical protein
VAWAEPTTDNAVVLPAREAGALARVVGMLLRLRPPRLRDDERLPNERLLEERLLDERLLDERLLDERLLEDLFFCRSNPAL